MHGWGRKRAEGWGEMEREKREVDGGGRQSWGKKLSDNKGKARETTRARKKEWTESRRMSEKQKERQSRAELKEYEWEEVNNECYKGRILRTNKSQINCVTRGSDEGQ